MLGDEDRSASWESIGVFPSEYQLPSSSLDEMDRNARAYGFEIGRGQALAREIETSQDNPFLESNWRDGVVEFLPEG